jgi:hypothetical protein
MATTPGNWVTDPESGYQSDNPRTSSRDAMESIDRSAHTSQRSYLDVYLIVFSAFATKRLYETICREAAKRVG